MKKRLPSPENADTLSLNALRGLVTGLLERSQQAEARLERLEVDNAELREENANLRLENTRLKLENQLLRDEIARLKNLSPRPPFRSSGMDKETDKASGDLKASKKKPRGPKLDVKRVSRQEVLRVQAPAGSRFKGYRSVYVRDLVMRAELVHYRRECWVTPDGKTVLAPLPVGTVGSYSLNLRRLCLMLYTQGQVTTGRLTTLLNDIGLDISKRQIVRLLTSQMDGFVAEDTAVLQAGLASSSYLTVDDTGARHSHKNAYLSNWRIRPAISEKPRIHSTFWRAISLTQGSRHRCFTVQRRLHRIVGHLMQINGNSYSADTSWFSQERKSNASSASAGSPAATDYANLADYGSSDNQIFQNLLKDPLVQRNVTLGADGKYSINKDTIAGDASNHLANASMLINAQNGATHNPDAQPAYSSNELAMFRKSTGYNLVQSGNIYFVVDDNGNSVSAADQDKVNAAWNAFDLAKGVEGIDGKTGDLTASDIESALQGLASHAGAKKAMYDDLMKMLENSSNPSDDT